MRTIHPRRTRVAMQRVRVPAAVALAASLLTVLAPTGAGADSTTITFEPATYSPGTINGQDGWSSTGSIPGPGALDHQVADNSILAVAPTSFGSQSLRMSNASTRGSFGDQTFSKPLVDEAGETDAANDGRSGGNRQSSFSAEWNFASTVPAGEQSGLSVVASPDRGDGARMGWVQMADTPAGLEVNFNEYRTEDGTCATGDFVLTQVAAGLSRTTAHSIKTTTTFVEGAANDVVRVYVDGQLRHTGTSWEDYFRECEGRPTRTVDSILFRTGGPAAPATSGFGFLIDDLILTSGPAGAVACAEAFSHNPSTLTSTLLADCTTDHTITVADGWTLDGDNHTITAVDPVGGFLGAVVTNGGSVAHVTDLRVTASNLAVACHSGAARLRGILFDNASGSITNSDVDGVRQGLSGCQEGNAIEVRNFKANGSPGTPKRTVTISGNAVFNYQKNGITANGGVTATITNNLVIGDGPVEYIAQNGIQVGYGASATIRSNQVSANWYSPPEYEACGILLYQAGNVKSTNNLLVDNEVATCGKGGDKGKSTA